jgi:adenosylcobinamide-phosphate synthase
MWGYPGMRSGRYWQWAGKWAARADDVLSWLPARITAVLMLLWQPRLLAQLPAEAARTPSPNSGWPMAAMALALGVHLGKPGVYVLNATGRDVVSNDVFSAVKLASNTLLTQVITAQAAIFLIAL